MYALFVLLHQKFFGIDCSELDDRRHTLCFDDNHPKEGHTCMAWAVESCAFTLWSGSKEICHVKNHGIFSKYFRTVLMRHKIDRQCRGFVVNSLAGSEDGKLEMKLAVPLQQLQEARIVFCTEAAIGHNQEAHPECNARVPAVLEGLEKARLTPQFRHKDVIRLENFSSATVDDIAAVHSKYYVRGMEKTLSEALRAAGAGMALVDSVIATSKMGKEPPIGFALIRPPGHHAVPSNPMGFCIFGNIAIAARHAQQKHGVKKILIIDFDVHHGNGTNDAFYDDPDIYFLSTHQAGGYPGTGKFSNIGEGAGEGTTLNLPLPSGSGDEAMSAVFDEVIVPVAQRFKPELILVSAGYDGHVLDPLGGLQFTNGTYYRLALNIKALAKELCGGRCVFFLEGGYNLKSLSDSISETFRAFLGENSLASKLDNPAFLEDEPTLKVREAIHQIKTLHSI
ncbi:hypothetical protein KP509_27G033000 [Ceratopteris richardii]|uniref:Histone deacetylase domain-containing protein n=2 Tax=Ceratopteris richardii TaxID=49495 RepID=A0A8T2RHB7_CERRI|nr:hypothetical protein KP509_27G033000 [Ceratopteris richardii]